jgi:hypothetical protein
VAGSFKRLKIHTLGSAWAVCSVAATSVKRGWLLRKRSLQALGHACCGAPGTQRSGRRCLGLRSRLCWCRRHWPPAGPKPFSSVCQSASKICMPNDIALARLNIRTRTLLAPDVEIIPKQRCGIGPAVRVIVATLRASVSRRRW